MAGDEKISPNVNYENPSSACFPVFIFLVNRPKQIIRIFLDTVEMERAGDIHLSSVRRGTEGKKYCGKIKHDHFPKRESGIRNNAAVFFSLGVKRRALKWIPIVS